MILLVLYLILAKVNFDLKKLRKITKNLTKRFDEFTSDSKELQKVARIVVKEIKANSAQGLGHDGNPLPSISDKWDERRAKLLKVNPKGDFTDLGSKTSKVSFMGDTLKKIKFKINGSKIEIFGDGNHRSITGIRGKKLKGSNASISDILKGLSDLGYKILGVSDMARTQIRNNFIRFIRRRLR